ncbi:MAG: PQQ-binding-like beta-propeller repeat protein [Candidatus Woesearchaeota archaeon]|nr:PQQ-binding-like beta-propeller repeat protein [Candidatus Woesearchaeota archaeon]
MRKIILFSVLLIPLILIIGCSQEGEFGKRPGSQEIYNPELPGDKGINEPPTQQEKWPEERSDELMLPPINTDLPLPQSPEGVPKGELIKKQLGDVEVAYFSTGIIRGMTESGLDYFIALKNKGSSEAFISITPDQELIKQVPEWNLHFFSFQNSPVKIAPGEEKKLWYFISLDRGGEETFTVNFELSQGGNSLNLPVVFGTVDDDLRGKETSRIYGYVKDENGNPVSNVRVDATMNCGRYGFRGDSDRLGRYNINVLGMEDINAIYARETACDSNDYFISADKEGYEYYFKGQVAPTRKDFVRLDIILESKKETVSYSMEWEKQVDDNYGFFWIKAANDFSVFAADQAKHPPQLDKPTNFYLFDSKGNVLWKQPAGNECWGIDIAEDGSKVTAGCHDNKIYTVDKSGKLLWSFDAGGMVRSACFSRDGKEVLSGAIQKLYLFDSDTGAKEEVSWIDEWFRNCRFYYDDSGFIVGARTLAGFDSDGNKKWDFVMGEFPMFLGVDNKKNVFAAGKSRTLFSFDADGNLRWKHRIPDHVAGAGAVTPDGSRIVLGTVGAMVYMFDNNGNLLWKRSMIGIGEEGGMGHNAITISNDGKRIVVGGAPSNCVMVYNEKGTMLWKGCNKIGNVSKDFLVGINSVQISDDKTKIVAAYGDNYVREFIGG